jgi:hypothetical protein
MRSNAAWMRRQTGSEDKSIGSPETPAAVLHHDAFFAT